MHVAWALGLNSNKKDSKALTADTATDLQYTAGEGISTTLYNPIIVVSILFSLSLYYPDIL